MTALLHALDDAAQGWAKTLEPYGRLPPPSGAPWALWVPVVLLPHHAASDESRYLLWLARGAPYPEQVAESWDASVGPSEPPDLFVLRTLATVALEFGKLAKSFRHLVWEYDGVKRGVDGQYLYIGGDHVRCTSRRLTDTLVQDAIGLPAVERLEGSVADLGRTLHSANPHRPLDVNLFCRLVGCLVPAQQTLILNNFKS